MTDVLGMLVCPACGSDDPKQVCEVCVNPYYAARTNALRRICTEQAPGDEPKMRVDQDINEILHTAGDHVRWQVRTEILAIIEEELGR